MNGGRFRAFLEQSASSAHKKSRPPTGNRLWPHAGLHSDSGQHVAVRELLRFRFSLRLPRRLHLELAVGAYRRPVDADAQVPLALPFPFDAEDVYEFGDPRAADLELSPHGIERLALAELLFQEFPQPAIRFERQDLGMAATSPDRRPVAEVARELLAVARRFALAFSLDDVLGLRPAVFLLGHVVPPLTGPIVSGNSGLAHPFCEKFADLPGRPKRGLLGQNSPCILSFRAG